MSEEKKPHELGLDKPLPRNVTYGDWFMRMDAVMSRLYGKDRAESHAQLDEMFSVYNMAFNPSQHNKACSGCVSKVHHRLSHYYKKYVLDAEKPSETPAESVPLEPKKKTARKR